MDLRDPPGAPAMPDDSAPFADALAHAWLDAICDALPHGHSDRDCAFCYAVTHNHFDPPSHAYALSDDDPAADTAY